MRHKGHYTILGITRGESPKGIRAAYLRLAKGLHPDHAGESSTQAFRAVQQAYDVLSDPERRRGYDDQLERKRPARTRNADPLTRRHRVEPLVPDEPLVARGKTRPSPVLDELFGRFIAGLTPIGGSFGTPSDVVDLDVSISVDQVARGGVFTIGLPERQTCSACAGSRVDWPFPCPACRQRRWIVRERGLRLQLPPGVRHCTVIHLQPEHTGGVGLRIRLLIDRRIRAPPL